MRDDFPGGQGQIDFPAAVDFLTARTSKDTRSLTDITTPKRQDNFACIPHHEESLATLRYLGFTKEKAAEIWNEWTNIPSRDRNDFFEHATNHLYDRQDHTDALDDSDDWRAVMDHYGLRKEIQETILNPRFKDIRFTESARDWIFDTMRLRFRTLKYAQFASRARARRLKNTPDSASHSSISHSHTSHQSAGDTKSKKREPQEEVTILWKATDSWTALNIFHRSDPVYGERMMKGD